MGFVANAAGAVKVRKRPELLPLRLEDNEDGEEEEEEGRVMPKSSSSSLSKILK